MPTVKAPGKHKDYELLEQAAEWFAVMQSGSVSEKERQDWQHWFSADKQHQQAWVKVEGISQQFNGLPVLASQAALGRTTELSSSRRQALKALACITAAAGLWQVSRQQQWGVQLLATHRTSRGEVRQFSLNDGSQLWLNTASAVDVAYSTTLRKIVLLKGELHIETAPDIKHKKRPLMVVTRHGRLRALGTRFSVKDNGNSTLLSITEGAVEVQSKSTLQTLRVEAGQQVAFNRREIQPASMLAPSSWTKGFILADNMRLDDFINELNRYYKGHLSVDPAAASLRLVGAYPVNDIERIFAALQRSHPVTVTQTLPWWVSIKLAAKG